MNKNKVINQLITLGLSEKEALIYFTLSNRSKLTLLEISRISGVNRTTTYRIAEKLEKKGLIRYIVDQYRIKLKIDSPDKLRLLIVKSQEKIEQAKQILPSLIKEVNIMRKNQSLGTEVIYYRGKEGLKQLLWNTLKAKCGIYGYGYASWNKSVGYKFAEKVRKEIVKRKIISKEIKNKNNLGKIKFTDIKNYSQYYKMGIIPKSLIMINHDTYIYNNIFAFYYFYNYEFFGIEIHNSEIAKTQLQIFNLLWKQAKKISIL